MSARRSWRGILKWTATAIGAVVVVGAGGVWGASEIVLRRTHDVTVEPAPVRAVAAADLAEGRRFAILVGCLEGCHGPTGVEGGLVEVPGIVSIQGPPLNTVLPRYSDDELVRLVRRGVKRDGTSALIMPAGTFHPIGDEDLGRLIGYLRSLEPGDTSARHRRDLSFTARAGLALGRFPTSAASVDTTIPRWGNLPRTTPHERGRYLASVICSECHGLALEGSELEGSPPLTIVAGYTREQFGTLLRTGVPASGRELGLMGDVARDAFVHFTEEEIDALYDYLRDRTTESGT